MRKAIERLGGAARRPRRVDGSTRLPASGAAVAGSGALLSYSLIPPRGWTPPDGDSTITAAISCASPIPPSAGRGPAQTAPGGSTGKAVRLAGRGPRGARSATRPGAGRPGRRGNTPPATPEPLAAGPLR